MTRKLACTLALGACALAVPATGSAQTFVDVGVWTPGGGGRAIVGGAPVYRAPVYPAPVYAAPVYTVPVYRRPVYRPVYVAPPIYVAQPYYRIDRGRHRGWGKPVRVYRHYDGPRYAGRDRGRRR